MTNYAVNYTLTQTGKPNLAGEAGKFSALLTPTHSTPHPARPPKYPIFRFFTRGTFPEVG